MKIHDSVEGSTQEEEAQRFKGTRWQKKGRKSGKGGQIEEKLDIKPSKG